MITPTIWPHGKGRSHKWMTAEIRGSLLMITEKKWMKERLCADRDQDMRSIKK